MTGIVCIWPFTVATIPPGWLLCDGTHDTPDMRGYVAIGARAGFDSGAVLGSDTHVHPFVFSTGAQSADHTHTFSGTSDEPLSGSFDAQSIGGVFLAYAVHVHEVSGWTGANIGNHNHSIDDVTTAVDSKQLSREILFIMKE